MAEPKIDDELLQRLVDGDLDADEEAAARASVAGDPAQAEALRRIERLGVVMRAAGAELETKVDSEALFARIQAGIEAGVEADADAVDPAADAHGRRPTDTAGGGGGSLWTRLFGHRAWIPATGLAAMAAAVLMTIFRPVSPDELERQADSESSHEGQAHEGQAHAGHTHEGHAHEGPTAPTDQGAQALGEDDPTNAAAARTGTPASSEIVQVDFGENAGTVFDVALSGGASTPVVWINDEE